PISLFTVLAMKKKLWLIHIATTTISIATRKLLHDRRNGRNKTVSEDADTDPVINHFSDEKEIMVNSHHDNHNQYPNTCTVATASRLLFKTLVKSNTQEEKSQIRSQNIPIKIVKIQSLSLPSTIHQNTIITIQIIILPSQQS
ncbi:unnamed protein product, partial [Vicia faba]